MLDTGVEIEGAGDNIVASKTAEKTAPVDHQVLEKRKAMWDETRKKIDQGPDSFADESMKDAVVALQLLVPDVLIVAASEGYLNVDNGVLHPMVNFAAPNRPEKEYNDEDKIMKEAAKEAGMSEEAFRKTSENLPKGYYDAYFAALEEVHKSGRTEEFEKWCQESDKMAKTMQEYLEEFYKGRESNKQHLVQLEGAEGFWQLRAGDYDDDFEVVEDEAGKHVVPKPRDATSEETRTLLKGRQAEMAAFTNYLQEQYYSQAAA